MDNQRELFIMFLMCELDCLDKYLKNAKYPDLNLYNDFTWVATYEGYYYWQAMDRFINDDLEYYMY